MKKAKPPVPAMLLAAFLLTMAPADVFAYLDPGTGSILLQGLLATVATALMFMRGGWDRLRNFLSRNSKKPDDDSDERG